MYVLFSLQRFLRALIDKEGRALIGRTSRMGKRDRKEIGERVVSLFKQLL
jgi:hypothetical protein